MDGRDILETRLDTLLDDLAKVSEAVATAAAKREHIAAALDSLRTAEIGMRALTGTAMLIQLELDTDDDGQFRGLENDTLMSGLVNLPRHVSKVVTEIATVKRLLEPVRDRMQAIAIDDQRALQAALQADCGRLTREVKQLKERLDDTMDLPALWAEYLDFVDTKARPVFDAYVDFISGLAVRDSDLDGSICAISDHLINQLLGQHEALSLPAREAALSMHAIIKLGFPEWGIWSVPLVAREAGASLLRHTTHKLWDLHDFLARPHGPLTVPEAERLAEDAIGAFLLGPAYARAMFTFRLRPGWPTRPGMPPDTLRAQIILAILRRQGAADGQDAFSDEVTRLTRLWNHALAELGADAGPPLDEAFATGVHTALRAGRRRDFSAENWGQVTAWADRLLGREGDDPPVLVEADRAVTLLNAGWLARRKAPQLADDIAKRLTELLRHPGGGGPSPQSRSARRPPTPHTPPGGTR